MAREKIIAELKNLSGLADKSEIPLQDVVDRLVDLIVNIEDVIENYKRKASKQKPQIPSGKITK